MGDNYSSGIGRVTERGIVFRDLYYSSDVAIKEQWFERARRDGQWNVCILFDETNLSRVILVEPHDNKFITCNLIERCTLSGQKLERYFQSIQKLKAIRNHKNRDFQQLQKGKGVCRDERTSRRSKKQKIQLFGRTSKKTT